MLGREFSTSIARRSPAPVYLFVGPDAYTRAQAREALTRAVLGDDDRESGFTRFDLEETSLAGVIDDASSLSLFAPRRLIWVSSAEAALPKRMTAKSTEDSESSGSALPAYLKNPTPETVIVFDCGRYSFEGDDKQKLDRVRKFYSAVPAVVEFPPYTAAEASRLVREIAQQNELRITDGQISTLVEALDADATRIVREVEKLALYASGRPLTDDDLAALVPNARTSTTFSLVNALARGDRREALDVLDALVREGEYLPLVLTFLGTQFRLALAAVEVNAKSSSQIQAHFSKLGVAMWRSRAEQLAETLRVFPLERLRKAVTLTYETDLALRDTRPDDRTMMENFVWKLTAAS